eukprot:763976-Hanusia_phi.AAC.2
MRAVASDSPAAISPARCRGRAALRAAADSEPATQCHTEEDGPEEKDDDDSSLSTDHTSRLLHPEILAAGAGPESGAAIGLGMSLTVLAPWHRAAPARRARPTGGSRRIRRDPPPP